MAKAMNFEETSKKVEDSGDFDAAWYVDAYPDVKLSNIEPLEHYVRFGLALGRQPNRRAAAARIGGPTAQPSAPALPFSLDELLKHSSEDGLLVPDKLSNDAWQSILCTAADGPLVSVIMPNYNRERVIMAAINSVKSQSYQNFEIIVCDDGSTDNSVRILKERCKDLVSSRKLILIESTQNGVSAARNRAIEKASGDLIAYLDTDNTWHAHHLALHAAALSKLPSRYSSYSAIRINNIDNATKSTHFRKFNREALLRSNFIDLNAYVHRRSMISALGSFDEKLRRLVDWDLIIRQTAFISPIEIPCVTVNYNLDSKGLSNITHTVPIAENRDRIFAKYSDEYARRGIRGKLERRPVADTLLVPLLTVVEQPADFARIAEQVKNDLVNVALAPITRGELLSGKGDKTALYWWPDPREPAPSADLLASALTAFHKHECDAVVLSYGPQEAELRFASSRNQTFLSKGVARSWVDGKRLMDGLSIFKIRASAPSNDARVMDCRLVFGESAKLLGSRTAPIKKTGPIKSAAAFGTALKRRPLVIAWAMKLAVGGVERNTVEVMRSLKDRYDFVYLATERTEERQGSIAAQIRALNIPILDLSEACNQAGHLELLATIKEQISPDLIWVCNGSMWLCHHAGAIRALFSDTPIVSQIVYDTDEGWVRRVSEYGIASFDAHIAVTKKIERKLVASLGFEARRVTQIYSVIDGSRFAPSTNAEKARRTFSLPQDGRIFAFMGRVVPQKRPLDFVRIAAQRRARADEFYVLVGSGELDNEVDQLIAAEKLTNLRRIKYVADTSTFWPAIDALLITSAYEGLPIAMIEALASGVPVISTDVGDIKAVLDAHKAGQIVPADQGPPSFDPAIDVFLSKASAVQDQLRKNAPAISQFFSALNISSMYDGLWKSLMKQYRRGI